MDKYEQRPDSGKLNASKSKISEKSPDYWGEIAINVNDLTNVTEENGLLVFKLSGWKKVSKSGSTYLSLSINRKVKENQTASKRPENHEDPF